MKKLAFLCGVALALGFTACDDELPNPPAQSNPQPEIFESAGLEISQAGHGVETPIELQALADEGTKATLADITKLEDFPEGFDLVFEVEMSTTEDFAKTVTIEAAAEDNFVVVPASTINTAIYDTFTHDPAEITLYTRLAAYARNGASSMRLGGKDALYGEYTYKFVPFTPDRLLENSYFLRYRNGGDWQTMPFVKADEQSVYDNGVFTVNFELTQGTFEWMVLPASAVTGATLDGIMGVSADETTKTSGTLVIGEGAEANVISRVSPYVITIDVVNLTFKVSLAFEELWVPGGATGATVSRALKLFTTDFVNYDGTMRLYNDWYLSAQSTKKGISFMLDGDQTESETGVLSGNLVQVADASGAAMSAANGLYYIRVNLGTMKYTATPVKQISVIGDFNEWDLETAVDLTPNSRFQKWTAKDVEMTAGEYKFCVDHSWALSYGGEMGDLRQNGSNLTLEKAGKYDIEIDFAKQPNVLKMTKK